ncbi:putative zinc-binding protein [Aminiphilus sp.]|uniref:putative zinc-binding protein n=1 Tax=Aminiphilus sp. TaxID=1872488 RepID=UPI0026053E0D|nr:putative zinc-binding protein [Aminiphilus sp.]
MLFSCSGAADLGALADGAARKLMVEGEGNMSCLALVATGSSGLALSARSADRVLALDGCGLDCARKCLEQAEIRDFIHLRLTDLGLKKGATPVTEETLDLIVAKAKELLAQEKENVLS